MAQKNSALMGYKDFIRNSERQPVQPGIWKWTDIAEKLDEVDASGPLNPGRPSVCLINKSTGDALGICPTLNAIIQVLDPGTQGKPHRHSNFAIFIVKEGHGHSVVAGERMDWAPGDVFVAPAWARHQHTNDSKTEMAILYTIQDVPNVARQGTWFFKGTNDSGDMVHNLATPK